MGNIILSGGILHPDGVSEVTIGVKDGIIDFVDSGIISGEGPIRGMIIPGLIDLHTHLGDYGARGHLSGSLEKVVFPGGAKDQFLKSSSRNKLISSIRSSLEEVSPGVTEVIDFREGGLMGLRLLEEARIPDIPLVHSFGRPEGSDDIEEILHLASGIGIPSLVPGLEQIRELCSKAEKPFAIHVSELFREDINQVLDLDPDLVIHMISGDVEDFTRLSENNIPVALCPRANRSFGLDVPLVEMFERNLSIGLGTDNALAVKQDMFREMESAWTLLRKAGIEGIEASKIVFDMATGRTLAGSSLLSKLPGSTRWGEIGWPRVGDPALLSLIKGSSATDHERQISDIVRFKGQKDVIWTGPN